MASAPNRIRVAVSRSLARGDTVIAILALWFAGRAAADGSLPLSVVLSLMGVVFMVSSGDYSWRKGFVAGKRSNANG